MLKPILLITLATLATATADYKLNPIYSGVKKDKLIQVVLTPAGDRLLVQQRGQVVVLPKDEAGTEATVFLNLKERKLEEGPQTAFEEGVVGMALHPKYAENRRCYVFYTQQEPKQAVLSEFTSPSAGAAADEATEKVLLRIPLPHWNHHGGNLVFGKDGLLYIGIGDGGGPQGGDPHQLAQNTFSYCGKILRIDVDKTSGNRPYGLPEGNPWLNKAGYHPEPVALGIRNPWGMCLDPEGDLWFADVGQNLQEEINLLEIGGNYGWSYREGTVAFPPRKDAAPEGSKFVEPVHTYSRDQGISITGGVIYQGKALPKLTGAFIYGDWGSGRIWALKVDKATKKAISNDLLLEPNPADKTAAPVKPTGFSLDENGEVLVLDWNGGIFRLN